MIETIRWLVRLNSDACCQIENYFRGLKHQSAERADAGRRSSERYAIRNPRIGDQLGSPKANEVRARGPHSTIKVSQL
jgi:hypothetical protein